MSVRQHVCSLTFASIQALSFIKAGFVVGGLTQVISARAAPRGHYCYLLSVINRTEFYKFDYFDVHVL